MAKETTEITDQEYVEAIVKPIVESPDEVVTNRTLDERGVLIQLTVNQADMGKIIGKEGQTAKSIRSLLRVFGARTNSHINLKIVEPEGSDYVATVKPGEEMAKAKIKAPQIESIPEVPAEEESTGSTTSVI